MSGFLNSPIYIVFEWPNFLKKFSPVFSLLGFRHSFILPQLSSFAAGSSLLFICLIIVLRNACYFSTLSCELDENKGKCLASGLQIAQTE